MCLSYRSQSEERSIDLHGEEVNYIFSDGSGETDMMKMVYHCPTYIPAKQHCTVGTTSAEASIHSHLSLRILKPSPTCPIHHFNFAGSLESIQGPPQ